MRALVAIANHGTKNARFLAQLLDEYRSMPFRTDVVVLSDTHKDLGPDVEVLVGAPTSDPWSLPFAHRRLFADRAEDYDLYIYSEDDTLVTERHVQAFLDVNDLLPDDFVPGFLRYEVFPTGQRSYCTVHSGYRWDPTSVFSAGGATFARFANEHAACYMLSRWQLEKAIASGGFLVEPHAGAYDMLVTAATDPYTQCGLTKVICISQIEEFLLHHLPNVYLGRLGVPERCFSLQLGALEDIRHGTRSAEQLSAATPLSGHWGKNFYAASDPALTDVVAAEENCRVLTIGCGTGDLERELFGPGAEIVAVPFDEVLGAVAADHGIVLLPPDLERALAQLSGEQFDFVLASDVLGHLRRPESVVGRLAALLRPSGRLVISAPNMQFFSLRRRLRRGSPPLPPRDGGFEEVGLHYTDTGVLTTWLRAAGLEVDRVGYRLDGRAVRVAAWLPRSAQRFLGRAVTIAAAPPGSTARRWAETP
jgi:SAM-dependent methyltransferase